MVALRNIPLDCTCRHVRNRYHWFWNLKTRSGIEYRSESKTDAPASEEAADPLLRVSRWLLIGVMQPSNKRLRRAAIAAK